MNNIKVSVDNANYDSISNGSQIRDIGERVAGNAETFDRGNIKEFAKRVSKLGRSFSPATFKDVKLGWADVDGTVTPENFEQQQLLTLQFDDNISFDEVKSRADRYDLPILFAYNSIPVGGHKPFRVVWLNDAQINDYRTADVMQGTLKTIFPEAKRDISHDAVRLCFGGKSMLHFAEDIPEIDAERLFRNVTIYLRDKHGKTHYKRALEKFSEQSGIRLNENDQLDVFVTDVEAEGLKVTQGKTDDNKVADIQCGNISPKTSILYVNYGEKLPSRYYTINYSSNTNNSTDSSAPDPSFTSAPKEPVMHKLYRSDTLNNINLACQLYQDFCSGERKLSSSELLGLATNLIQVEGSKSKFKQILSRNHYYDTTPEKYSNWDFSLSYIKNYTPYLCAGYCPHSDSCSHGSTILSTSKPKYHQMERLANYAPEYVSLQEAWEDFNRCFSEAIEANDTKVHVIKAQTAMGKSEAFLDFCGRTSLQALVAAPTNILKRELSERGAAKGVDFMVSPSLHEIKDELPDDVWSDICELYQSGKSVMPYMKKAIKENRDCAKTFKNYLEKLGDFNDCTGNAITTHKRLTTLDTRKYDVVIIDEDIILSTVIPNRGSIRIKDLRKLRNILKKDNKTAANNQLAAKTEECLAAVKTSEYFELHALERAEADADISMAVDLSKFCTATHFCYRKDSGNDSEQDNDNSLPEDCVTYMIPVKFRNDVKHIIVSATVDEKIYCDYFGTENVIFYECKQAKYKGRLIQFYDKPMSRNYIDRSPGIIERIKDRSGFKDTITFKKYHKGKYYFGNCAGCDTLKGKDIDVIGTPHQTEWIYKLFAFSMRIDFDPDERLSPHTIVERHGYRLPFTTFKNEDLQAVQFYIIESEAEQAVGRARLLRCDCTVNYYSNYPLPQATMRASEYDN